MATKPEDVNPFAQFVEQPKEAPNPFAQFAQNRTAGEAFVTDPLSSFLGGIGSTLASPSQISRLFTGEKPPAEAKGTTQSLLDSILPFGGKLSDIPSTVLEKLTPTAPSVQGVTDLALNPFAKFAPVGEELKAFGEKNKSAGLKASELELSNKINDAHGFFNEAGVAIAGTLTNPALLSDFIFAQIPNMAAPLGGGAVSKGLVKTFLKDATTKTLDRAGVTGAVLTGAAMQGGDIGSDTYKTVNDRLIKEGMDPEKAHGIALEKARVAAAEAAAISVASSFIPGGRALEKRFLTQAGKESAKKGATSLLSKITNVVGEASQEGIEEGGGKLASNVQVQQVFPETDIMKGVGAAAGQGAIGGGLFGGLSNLQSRGTTQVPPAPPAPTVTPTETAAPANVPGALVTEADLETSEPAVTPAATPVSAKEKIAKLMEPKPNNPVVEEEGLKIVEELKRLGHVPFAEGMESNIKGGGFETPAQLDFYRQKLEEAKSLAQEEGKEFHEEHNIDKYLSGNKADQKRFAAFLPKAPEQVRNIVAQSNDYLQRLTDQINAKGYKLLDVDSRAPQDVQALKAQISGIAGSTVSLVKNAEHIEKNNRFANPEKFEKIALTLSNDYKNANQLLGKVNEEEKPAQQEAVQVAENVPEATQTAVKAEAKPEEVQVQQEPSKPTQPIEERPGAAYEKRASDDYNKVVDESYDGKKNDTDVLANQSLDRYIPFDKLVDIVKNAEDVLLAPEQLKMRFGVQKAADANRVIQAVRKARTTSAKNKQEKHVEANKTEPITPTVIAKSAEKAATNVDTKKLKSIATNQFDQAIKRSQIITEKDFADAKLPESKRFVTIDIPGDGKFKLENYKENLEKRKKEFLAALKPIRTAPVRATNAASISSPESAFKAMVNDGDIENALKYADLKALDVEGMNLNDTQRQLINKYQIQNMPQPNIEPGKKQTAKERIAEIHEEQIKEYSSQKRELRHLSKQVAEGKVNLTIQRRIAELLESTSELKQDIRLSTPKNNSAQDFLAQALRAYKRKALSKDVLDVIQYLYNTRPELLNGIKLSVRQSKEDGVMGNFAPLTRLVTLYRGLGSESVTTARHEIMHSLEQMMNSEQRSAIIDAWSNALQMAIKQHGDDLRSSQYFNAVQDFIKVPNETNFKRAVSIMPSKDFYQFINPSEYWAVNAEKLMAAKMGTPWAKFVKFVKGLGEALKALFGLENDHALHTTFNELIKGKTKRMDKESLTSYMNAGDLSFDFLNDVQETDDILERHDRSDAPIHTSTTVTDRLLGGTETAKAAAAKIMKNPKAAVIGMVGGVDRGLLNARVQTTNFIAGLEAADRQRYEGELEDGQKRAIASVAMTQALKASRIGTRVILIGKLAFDSVQQTFNAVQDKFSMANIMSLKHDLEKEIGAQRAANVIQAYFEAKRSKSINQEYADRAAELNRLLEEKDDLNTTSTRQTELIKEIAAAEEDVKNIKVALDKVNLDEDAIEDFINFENQYPQLKEMMENWTSVNRNMIDMMEFSHIISEKRAETLRNIKDYVPWQRIQDEQEDPHSFTGPSKGVGNISREHRFKEGKVNADINDIVDNMLHNVLVTTRNSIRNYAANRIAQEYGERNEKGKLKVYPKEDPENGIVKILVNGRKINIKISDPLIAQAVIGVESFQMPMSNMMAAVSNFLRRSITLSGVFQVKQLFMDAPTAALVSGVKNPVKLYGSVFGSFIKALAPTVLKPVDYVINKFTPFKSNLAKEDPIIELLKNHGIGGYHSMARSAERELKQQIGLINKSTMSQIADILDRIGDASDIAQRRAVYKRVMAESNGDQRKAIMAANNIIDFDKRGAAGAVNYLNRTVAFMNAYAQQIDVLTQALAEPVAGLAEKATGTKIGSVSGNLRGLNRQEAMMRLAWAGFLLASATIAYTVAVADDDEYKKMDDQTKMRNFVIPKSMTKHIGMDHSILIPMHTSGSWFFKSVPEMMTNKILQQGTKDTVDQTRLTNALFKGFMESMFGPIVSGPIPTAIKPGIEIALNHDFYTGNALTPDALKTKDVTRQYKASTSELGKWLSAASLGTLNPIEADKVMRGLGGSMAAIAMTGSNMFNGNRATPTDRENVFYGSFISPDVPRGREDLFYDYQKRTQEAFDTYTDLMKKGHTAEGQKWYKDNHDLIVGNGYAQGVGKSLQQINAEIRRTEDVPAEQFSPQAKRDRITALKKTKEDMLRDIIQYRLKAGL